MSVLVEGMNMPKNCLECPIVTDYDTCGFCAMRSSRSELEAQWNARPDDCPLVEIPPHGDLIDRDALLRSDNLETLYDALRYSPAFIPAEDGDNDV